MNRYNKYLSTGYDRSYHHYFWQWEEGSTVASIPGCNTIAYRKYIEEVLEALLPQGLPPFGTILLAILATNPNGKESIGQVKAIMKKRLGQQDIKMPALDFLDILASVPDEYKSGKKRMLLFQTIFEQCHNRLSTQKSAILLSRFKCDGNPAPISCPEGQWHEDLHPILLLNRKFPDVKSILEKMAPLPLVEEMLNLDIPDTGLSSGPDFIEELIESPKTFHVGALIKRIWGGLHIPFHNILPSRQPMGGVSDLTNKGDLDRLLISEFANDDITFLSRLANNEALYINREIPPENNNRERVILIDVSIRNWGTPRIIAFAVMMAIARHPKTNIRCSAFVVGESCQPVSSGSVDEVIDGLQKLDGCLHAATGLEQFFREHKKSDQEVFFISSADATKYPAIQNILNRYHTNINYWIHTNAEGGISVYKRQHSSKRHIQDIKLNLGESSGPVK